MKKIFLFLFMFIVLLFVSMEGAIPAEERAALIALYNAANGDNWRDNSGWKDGTLEPDGFGPIGSESTWKGITVSGDHVTDILLDWNNLVGSIPADLENFSHLGYLDLCLNQLSGPIPPGLGNLSNLSYLNLESNQLSGSIPAGLGNLNQLRNLNLVDNQLSGSIPAELGNLSKLEDLNLTYNQLSGNIPSELGGLFNLQRLDLMLNQLSGGIPPELGNLSNLRDLYLRDNQLSSSMPSELGNLSSLEVLDLGSNQLSGSIPAELGNISNLCCVYLNNNQLSGSIPPELGNSSSLYSLDLSSNQLSGSIPPELGNHPRLNRLDLSSNQLSGSIPAGLGNLNQLLYLYLNNNQLSGGIPAELGNISALYYLNLRSNQLSGSIPSELEYLSNLQHLFLDNNQLSGSIPMELENISHLIWLRLDNNRLSGNIPPELGNLTDLDELRLNGNQLTGLIPPTLVNLTKLAPNVKTNFGYNGLYTNDETVRTFLNSKDPDWEETQTIAPSNVSAVPISPSSISVSWPPIAYTGDTGGYEVYSSTTSGGPWAYLGITPDKSVTSYTVTGLDSSATYYFVIKTRTNAHTLNFNTIVSECSEEALATTPVHWPAIVLDRTRLNFGYVIGGNVPGSQSFTISSTYGILNWTASGNVSWLNVSPSSGTGSGVVVAVSVDPLGLAAGTYAGAIGVADPNAGNSPQTIPVELTVYKAGANVGPFGEFSTPIDGAAVRGSIAVTGWVLDDVGVESVKIYREEDENLVYIGDAVFVEGARPDVEQAYPDYPMNYKAGWGYMMLTHFLPDGGNGTFKLHAIASDTDGNIVTLGTKTITCDNANAVNPFGAIDTPAQGGAASGSDYRNHGWVLTPSPNAIPTDGSTINVYINGVNMGHPTYNVYRSDIAELFPGYANSSGAHAYFDFDTTAYENGVHTIYWTATDDAGNTDGIGSRYSLIQNSQGARSRGQGAGSRGSMEHGAWSMEQSVACLQPVGIIKGYARGMEPQAVYPNDNGMINIEIIQLERLEIHLSAGFVPEAAGVLAPPSIWTAFHVVGDQFKPLPIGSTLDIEKGIFYWQAGPAFIGEYWFVFVEKRGSGKMIRKDIKVTIR